jgi:hypothetical protein
MVPGALALLAAVVGIAWVLIERRQARASERRGIASDRKDRYCIRNSNSTDLEDLEARWTNSGLLFEARKIATSRVAVDDLTRAVGDWPMR